MANKPQLTEKDMSPENVKANITIRISGDVLEAYRAEAKKMGIGYQTLMQIKLREAIFEPDDLRSRVEKIEKRVFKKNG